ncbi:hypothetical protein F4780DRAFT_595372 [Xylariomycetidae sp. FL0641]|nr:hypothetical protein F4780DRAFT_595372 [Xylariomycetidae sp. FL0641]
MCLHSRQVQQQHLTRRNGQLRVTSKQSRARVSVHCSHTLNLPSPPTPTPSHTFQVYLTPWDLWYFSSVYPCIGTFKLHNKFGGGRRREQTDMPPKRKATGPPPPPSAPKERQSKLAKEHGISAREEREIQEAFALFAEPGKGKDPGVIPSRDVRRAMVALGIPPSKPELREFLSILDPDSEGFAGYEPFVAICALKLHARDSSSSSSSSAEVDEAFRLFVGGGPGQGEAAGPDAPRLTLAHLKRVAMTLKQDVDEDLLRDMILEANGGKGVSDGVARDEFEAVMRRAGAWK